MQITMVFAYWKQKRHDDFAVFELFFRHTPFKGEFAICAGIDEVKMGWGGGDGGVLLL